MNSEPFLINSVRQHYLSNSSIHCFSLCAKRPTAVLHRPIDAKEQVKEKGLAYSAFVSSCGDQTSAKFAYSFPHTPLMGKMNSGARLNLGLNLGLGPVLGCQVSYGGEFWRNFWFRTACCSQWLLGFPITPDSGPHFRVNAKRCAAWRCQTDSCLSFSLRRDFRGKSGISD